MATMRDTTINATLLSHLQTWQGKSDTLSDFLTAMPVAALSATVEDPDALAQYLGGARIVQADPGPAPDIAMLDTALPPPWAGGGGRHAARDVMEAIQAARLTLRTVLLPQ